MAPICLQLGAEEIDDWEEEADATCMGQSAPQIGVSTFTVILWVQPQAPGTPLVSQSQESHLQTFTPFTG